MSNKDKTNGCAFGVLFDLDGVLIDSEGVYTEFWHNVDQLYPTGVTDFEYVIKGNTLNAILVRYFPDTEIQNEILRLLNKQEEEMVYRLFPGVDGFLKSLRSSGIPSAIVTSSNPKKMEHVFESLPVLRRMVDIVVTDEDVTRSKPDPQGYNLAAQRLGLAPEKCVVFEDSMAGVEAGKRAGGKVVGVATSNPPGRLGEYVDIVVDNTSDMTVEGLYGLFVNQTVLQP